MRYVIIGSGAAGLAAAKTIRERDSGGSIQILSHDQGAYARCMLHLFVSGKRTEESLTFVQKDFWERYQVEHIPYTTVTGIDTRRKKVRTKRGDLPYDRLLIASGSVSSIPPIPGLREAENVSGFRDLADAVQVKNLCGTDQKIVIMGSGLVGVDVAYALTERKMPLTIVDMAPRMSPRQTDDVTAGIYQRKFEEAGVTFWFDRGVGSVEKEGNRLTHIVLSDGTRIPCDYLIAAAGVRPNIGFLQDSGIETDRGIGVDAKMQTNVPDVYAAGDVTGLSGIWPAAVEQGRAAAINMTGGDQAPGEIYSMRNTMNFFGIPMISLGIIPETECEIYTEETEGEYGIAAVKDGCILGIHKIGRIDHSGIWEYLIKNKVQGDWNAERIFHISAADFYDFPEDTRSRRAAVRLASEE